MAGIPGAEAPAQDPLLLYRIGLPGILPEGVLPQLATDLGLDFHNPGKGQLSRERIDQLTEASLDAGKGAMHGSLSNTPEAQRPILDMAERVGVEAVAVHLRSRRGPAATYLRETESPQQASTVLKIRDDMERIMRQRGIRLDARVDPEDPESPFIVDHACVSTEENRDPGVIVALIKAEIARVLANRAR